jgi:hypothetical protein
MIITNPDLLKEVNTELVLDLHKILDGLDDTPNYTCTITSGKRNGDGKSWHDKGLAIDFCVNNVDHFEIVTYVIRLIKNYCKKITEFEVCKAGPVQHFHIARGDEGYLQEFTGVYT